MKRACLVALIAFLVLDAAPFAQAQTVTDKPVSWQFYGGWTVVGSPADDLLEDGWDFGFGVTYHPQPGKPFGLKFDTDYSWFDATNKVTNNFIVDHGRASSWAFTGDFVYESQNRGKVGWYAGAGVGGYYLYGQLTEDAIVGGYYCDFWGYCYYVPVAGEYIIADTSTIKFGWNAQFGIRFKLNGGSEIALETKYNWVETKKTFEYYPINIAFRF